jgi:hypothetical protein
MRMRNEKCLNAHEKLEMYQCAWESLNVHEK